MRWYEKGCSGDQYTTLIHCLKDFLLLTTEFETKNQNVDRWTYIAWYNSCITGGD